jgi:beta-glucosidase
MSSYNKINGTYTSESRDLLTTITRDEWGFQGTVMTDWFGGTDAPAQVYAGNDLLMPGRPNQKEDIMKALEDGSLSEEFVDTNAKRILELIVVSPRFRGYEYSNKPDLEAHAKVTRQAGAEGMILLKNSEALLPLPETVRKVAAFGNTSYAFIAGGTGSGDVNEAYTVSLVEGLENAGFELDEDLKEEYLDYRKKETEKREKNRSRDMMSAFMPPKPFEEYLPSERMIRKMAVENDIAFITIGRNSGEFMDRILDDDFLLTNTEKDMLAKVSEIFHQEGKKVVVILNIGGVIETACWKDLPDAILLAWQGGQEGGNAVADVLTGKVNPSGKLTMTFPVAWEDHPSSANFPTGKEAKTGDPLMAIMQNGESRPERDPIANVDYTEYKEGVFVGYRAFEHNGTEVSYPFGYGLSYTTFQYGEPEISVRRGVYTVSLDITNTGNLAGKEAVQLYVAAPGKDMIKPEKELKAFAKTGLLGPGQTGRVEMVFTTSDLASFDQERSGWVTEPGTYKICLGASSADVRSDASITVKKEIFEAVNNVLTPQI